MDQDGARGVSTVVATVLLVAIVLGGVATLAALSSQTVDEQTGAISGETARTDLSRVSAAVERVAYTDRRRRVVDIGTDTESPGGGLSVASGGLFRVDVGRPGQYRTVVDTSIGRFGTDTGDGRIAYQAGGIFRRHGGSSSIVRAPPITVRTRNATAINLPVFTLDGDVSVSDDVRLSATGRRDGYDRVAVPPDQHVRVSVRSSFDDAWTTTLRRTVPPTVGQFETTDDGVTVTLGRNRSTPLYLHATVYEITAEDA